MAVKGNRDELQKFADIVNSLPTRKQAAENGFGPYWLGNLVDALGGNWEEVPCRGDIDPNPDAPACLIKTQPEPKRLSIDNDGALRFTITMAWSLESDLLIFIQEKYPSFEFYYKTTDEFGNFHYRRDPFNLIDNVVYEIESNEWYEYSLEQRNDFIKDLEKITGLKVPEDANDYQIANGEFLSQFLEWRENLPEDDPRQETYFIIWLDTD